MTWKFGGSAVLTCPFSRLGSRTPVLLDVGPYAGACGALDFLKKSIGGCTAHDNSALSKDTSCHFFVWQDTFFEPSRDYISHYLQNKKKYRRLE